MAHAGPPTRSSWFESMQALDLATFAGVSSWTPAKAAAPQQAARWYASNFPGAFLAPGRPAAAFPSVQAQDDARRRVLRGCHQRQPPGPRGSRASMRVEMSATLT